MKAVRALVLAGYGLNCDHETSYAFERAGARSQRLHINSLIRGEARLTDYHVVVFVGGFSWGDDHGAGVVEAVRLRTHIGDQLLAFLADKGLILGICNGFQALVNLGLLPGFDADYTKRCVALTWNDCGNFRDQWVTLRVNPDSPCVYTRGLDLLELPVRHAEGKLYAKAPVLERLFADGQVALRYALSDGSPAKGRFPENPNGSLGDVAGICDPTGRVFGLMPHPEAFNHWTNHPQWTRIKEQRKRQGLPPAEGLPPGILLFENAVRAARERM